MDGTREASPDWLREFQAPLQTFTTLSSSPSNSPSHEVPYSSKKKLNVSVEEEEQQSKLVSSEKGRDMVLSSDTEEETTRKTPQKSKATKSRVGAKRGSARKNENRDSTIVSKMKIVPDVDEDSKKVNATDPSILKVEGEGDGNKMEVDIGDAPAVDEDNPEKRAEPRVASRLPLVFADRVQRTKALLECEEEALDFSGDVGAVGRLVVSDTSTKDHDILLDLKGTIYKTTIVPSYTLCVVNIGQSEAKIEAIMDDFIQLQPHSNVYETETMVEGTLDGFLFDSDEEAEKVTAMPGQQSEQKNEAADGADAKPTKKSDKQSTGLKRKRSAMSKPAKKASKKAPSTKKQKASKK